MRTHFIKIQNNIFNAVSRPTTQEDNHGHIIDRYDLYYKYHNENNGNETMTKQGHLVVYREVSKNGNTSICIGAVFHNQHVRYDFNDIEIIQIR
jgi:hypothetical protein